jgi:hypothetical protein
VQERSEGHWPWFVRFWDEDLPTVGWRRCEAPRVQALRGGKLRFGILLRGYALEPLEARAGKRKEVPPEAPAPKLSWLDKLRSWLDKLVANVRRCFHDAE